MKIDKLNLDGKKDSIEVLDKIFSAIVNFLISLTAFFTKTSEFFEPGIDPFK